MKVTKSMLKQMILEGIDEVFAPGDPRYKATADISGLTHDKGKRDPGSRDIMRYTVSSKSDITPEQVKSAKNFIMPKNVKPLTADQALQQVQDILAAKELPTEKKLKAAHDFLMLNLYPKDAPSLVEKDEEPA